MIRSQIVLDEPIVEHLRQVSMQTGASMSQIVRKALSAYFEEREPDLSWVGSLRPTKRKSHDLDDIRTSVAAHRRREHRR